MSEEEPTSLKQRIKSITDAQLMREFVVENHDEISAIPTTTLNLWNQIHGWKFSRAKHLMKYLKIDETRYNSIERLREKIKAQSNKIMAQDEAIKQLQLVLAKIIEIQHLDQNMIFN
jgi:hypothetical protein